MSERDELVARLREGTFGSDITKTDVFLNTICSAAAAQIERDGQEIERLTAENERLRVNRDFWKVRFQIEARTRIRMREALARIALP